MCFGRVPPEINSGRMFHGAGSSSMVQAAQAWDQLAETLRETSACCRAVAVQLSHGWQGRVAVAVTCKMAGYLGWLDVAAEQAARAGAQARKAAAAHASVVAALVSPETILINRARLLVLAATNHLGQSSAAIADTEAEYERMWVTDSDAMYAYARASADASVLGSLDSPVVTADLAEAIDWKERDRCSARALKNAPDVIAAGQQVIETLPTVMRALSSSAQTTLDVHLLPVTVSLSKLSSLSPSAAVAVRNLNFLNRTAMVVSAAATAATTRNRMWPDDGPCPLGIGRGASIGTLSVPQLWVVRITPVPDVVEPQSFWVWEPMRLVHAAASQQGRHDDRCEHSDTTHGE